MARKKFSITSERRFADKVGAILKARGASETTVVEVVNNWKRGFGEFHALRTHVMAVLAQSDVPRGLWGLYLALAQKAYKFKKYGALRFYRDALIEEFVAKGADRAVAESVVAAVEEFEPSQR